MCAFFERPQSLDAFLHCFQCKTVLISERTQLPTNLSVVFSLLGSTDNYLTDERVDQEEAND